MSTWREAKFVTEALRTETVGGVLLWLPCAAAPSGTPDREGSRQSEPLSPPCRRHSPADREDPHSVADIRHPGNRPREAAKNCSDIRRGHMSGQDDYSVLHHDIDAAGADAGIGDDENGEELRN